MARKEKRKSLTLRLPEEEYAAAQWIAERLGNSMNEVLQEGLRLRLAQEEHDELCEAFSLVGREEDCGVEFAFHAQAEVALSDD